MKPRLPAQAMGWLLALCVVCTGSSARADQARDFMVDVQPEGTYLMLDIIFPGAQATLQHNVPVYGEMNRLRLRANGLMTLAFYESQADVEMRILFVTLGLSGGFRDTFRTLTFAPDEPITRGSRRGKDSAAGHSEGAWGFAEGRIELSFPFNDHFVVHNRNAFRLEARPERSFDYRTGVVHDGRYIQSDIMALVKHRKYGAIGPQLQVLNFDLDDERHRFVNVGGVVVFRPGFFRANDIMFLSVLFNPGDALGGDDTGPVYGAHMFYGPFTFQLAYRAILDLGEMELR